MDSQNAVSTTLPIFFSPEVRKFLTQKLLIYIFLEIFVLPKGSSGQLKCSFDPAENFSFKIRK